MKKTLVTIVRLIALILLYFVCFSAVSGALFSSSAEQPAAEQTNAAVALFLVSCINSAVLAFVILRSTWSGWKLVAAAFILMFGVITVMPQIETAFFITRLPPGMLPRIILAGAIVAALFSPLAVLILGKRKHGASNGNDRARLNMPIGEWVWKVALIVVLYISIYFTFGYFIAWQNAAVRAYYGGSDPGSFLAQMISIPRETPWLLPLQVLRGMLWTVLAVIVVRMSKGGWWEAGLTVALLFGVVMNTQLLIPNPFMPPEVRMVHLLETASSNFLFGFLLVGVLSLRNSSLGPNSWERGRLARNQRSEQPDS
jgi:hypothetical protein